LNSCVICPSLNRLLFCICITYFRIYVHHSCTCSCTSLARTSEYKYLGVIIDDCLRWRSHIDALTKKTRQLMFIFRGLREIFDDSILRSLYLALGQSILSYGIVGWGGMAKSNLSPAIIAQKSLLKVTFRKPYRYPSDQLFGELRVLDLRQLYIKTIIKQIHNDPTKYLPHYVLSLNTRNRSLLHPATVHTTFAQRHYIYLAPRIYNKIIPDLLTSLLPNNTNINKLLTLWLLTRGREGCEKDLICVLR
jgi:hypothetical protein